MKTLSAIFLLLLSLGAVAQSEGDTKDIDGQIFKYNKGIWVHQALGDSYTVTDAFTAVYKDSKWAKWYSEGAPTLKKILDLGPNVVFKFKGGDGQFYTYATFKNRKLAKKAIAGGAAAIATGLGGSALAAGGAAAGAAAGGAAAASGATILGVSATTAAVVAGGVVAGAVIINEANDDDDDSPTKR